jgi:hypothetical protein
MRRKQIVTDEAEIAETANPNLGFVSGDPCVPDGLALDGSVCHNQTANLRPAACSVISRDLRFCRPFLTSR